jgi:hypothetical protein
MGTMPKNEAAVQTANGPNNLSVKLREGESKERKIAEIGLSAMSGNATTAMTYAKSLIGELSLPESIDVFQEKAARVQRGDLSEVESMLTAQAAVLDVVFNVLAKRAASNMGQSMVTCETYLRMALKAQSQCRQTLETLTEVKYPKAATFVRQQNIAAQQQVNNGVPASSSPAHAKNANLTNELISEADNATLDEGRTGTTGATHPDMATVGAVHRA